MDRATLIKELRLKLIFLDVDGVLNCHHTKERAPSGVIGIDPQKVLLLRQIVQETHACIVLTSSWQGASDRDFHYLCHSLDQYGLSISSMSGAYGNWHNRGQVIRAAVQTLKPSAWVVLDDDQFPDFKEYRIGSHLVQTSFYKNGLEPKHVKRAIKMLEGKA